MILIYLCTEMGNFVIFTCAKRFYRHYNSISTDASLLLELGNLAFMACLKNGLNYLFLNNVPARPSRAYIAYCIYLQ